MQVTNPMTIYCVYLILLLPGIWLLGFWLARKATNQLDVQVWLAPGIGVALWLLLSHFIAKSTISLTAGLMVSTIIIATLGFAIFFYDKKTGYKYSIIIESDSEITSYVKWVSALVTTLGVALIALTSTFHDELYITGHMSIISQMQNGTYPPVHLSFPGQPLKYHYGFDLFATTLTALFRIPVVLAIDVAAMLLWFYTWCLLWLLGEKLATRNTAGLLPLIVLFSGGLPFFAEPPLLLDSDLAGLVGLAAVDGNPLNASTFSYFFQHPWSIGLSLAICILLLAFDSKPIKESWRYVVIGLLFVVLSLSQVVLFLTVFGSFLLAELVAVKDISKKNIVKISLLFLVVVILVFSVGGFFQYTPGRLVNLLSFRFGAFDNASTYIEWYLLNFGFLIPAGVAGMFFINKGRVFFFTMLVGSLVVFNFVNYNLSHDINKFATIITITLSFLSFMFLSRLIDNKLIQYSKTVATVATVLIISSGLTFFIVAALNPQNSPIKMYDVGPAKVDDKDVEVINWLRVNAHQGDIVLRMLPEGIAYSQQGGLAQLWVSTSGLAFGVPSDIAMRRFSLQNNLPSEVEPYKKVGLKWIVLSSEDKPFTEYVNNWLENGEVKLRKEFELLNIYEL